MAVLSAARQSAAPQLPAFLAAMLRLRRQNHPKCSNLGGCVPCHRMVGRHPGTGTPKASSKVREAAFPSPHATLLMTLGFVRMLGRNVASSLEKRATRCTMPCCVFVASDLVVHSYGCRGGFISAATKSWSWRSTMRNPWFASVAVLFTWSHTSPMSVTLAVLPFPLHGARVARRNRRSSDTESQGEWNALFQQCEAGGLFPRRELEFQTPDPLASDLGFKPSTRGEFEGSRSGLSLSARNVAVDPLTCQYARQKRDELSGEESDVASDLGVHSHCCRGEYLHGNKKLVMAIHNEKPMVRWRCRSLGVTPCRRACLWRFCRSICTAL